MREDGEDGKVVGFARNSPSVLRVSAGAGRNKTPAGRALFLWLQRPSTFPIHTNPAPRSGLGLGPGSGSG